MLPVVMLYIAHFLPVEGFRGTGFITGDMVSYMANARQHFDEGHFNFFYSNPFCLDENCPHIYFQLQTLLLSILLYLTGANPGLIFALFGFVALFFTIILSLKFFKNFVGWGTQCHLLTFILFIYGGGILVIAGFFHAIFKYDTLTEILDNLLFFDPGGGFWMLNFGRNFVYPTETYYHLITIGIIWSAFIKKHLLTSLLLLALSLSHPFYGIQFFLIIISWQAVELILKTKEKQLPKSLFLNILLISFHVFYYLVWMKSFPSHAIIIKQWEMNWILPATSAIFAYSLLLLIFILLLRKNENRVNFFKDSFNRLLLLYFLISLGLANHELFIKPIQPIHFTHGHIYIPLFLMVAKYLVDFFNKQNFKLKVAKWALFLILLSDNLTWYPGISYIISTYNPPVSVKIDNSTRETLTFLQENYNNDYILVSNQNINYLASAYTSVKPFFGHDFNTPYATARKKAFKEITETHNLSILEDRKVVFVIEKNNFEFRKAILKNKKYRICHENESYYAIAN